MFKAMWNNFYNAIVRNVKPVVKGTIIVILLMLTLICLIQAFKKGDEKKPIKNWFAFWCCIICLALLITYVILLSL